MDNTKIGGVNDSDTESPAVEEQALEKEVETQEQDTHNETDEIETQETDNKDESEDYDELVRKLQEQNLPLGKVKRFKELVDKNRQLREELESMKKTSTPKEEIKETSTAPFFDESLEETLKQVKAQSEIKFKEYEYDDQGQIKGGGYSTFSDLADDITKQVIFTMTKIKEINESRQKEVEQKANQYYNELIDEVKSAFSDDDGVLDDKSYTAYMESLKGDHQKRPVQDVRQHLIGYLKKQLKTNPKQSETNKDRKSVV